MEYKKYKRQLNNIPFRYFLIEISLFFILLAVLPFSTYGHTSLPLLFTFAVVSCIALYGMKRYTTFRNKHPEHNETFEKAREATHKFLEMDDYHKIELMKED